MNIIFMGTPEFAVASLQAIMNSRHNVLAVVTGPDKPKGRGLKVSENAVKKFTIEHNLKILQPVILKDYRFIDEIRYMNPDLIVVVAFKILPRELFTASRFGAINLHASLLPKYRGAAPINWAIINGETETGVTTFFLKEKVDTGNIILQKNCSISFEDDFGTLYNKLKGIGADILLKTIDMIELNNGSVQGLYQIEEQTSSAPKLLRDTAKINWHNDSYSIYNLIRGLSPRPGAFTYYNEKILKIFKTEIKQLNYSNTPGTISVENDKIFIRTLNGTLEIKELMMEGKKRMKTSDFLRGSDLQNGHILG